MLEVLDTGMFGSTKINTRRTAVGKSFFSKSLLGIPIWIILIIIAILLVVLFVFVF